MTSMCLCGSVGVARRAATALCALGCLLLLITGLTGCKSSSGGGDVSVSIPGVPIERIRTTASQVFASAGYALRSSTPQQMDFERAGSKGDALLYGGWDGNGVTTRVRVRFDYGGEGVTTLVATVYNVRDAGDLAVEDETRKFMFSRGPYRKLLDEVKQKCTAPK